MAAEPEPVGAVPNKAFGDTDSRLWVSRTLELTLGKCVVANLGLLDQLAVHTCKSFPECHSIVARNRDMLTADAKHHSPSLRARCLQRCSHVPRRSLSSNSLPKESFFLVVRIRSMRQEVLMWILLFSI
jgi:hypothetical protein